MSNTNPTTLDYGQCILVPVDVKKNKDYPPSVHCAPVNAEVVLDDRALICRSDDGSKLSVRFASEVGGAFGAGVSQEYARWYAMSRNGSFIEYAMKPFGLMFAKFKEPDAFSRYTFEVSAANSISLTDGKDIYAVDDMENAKRSVAGAVACLGYTLENTPIINSAQDLYMAEMTTTGATLPEMDRITHQKGSRLTVYNSSGAMISGGMVVSKIAHAKPPLVPNLGAGGIVSVDVKANDLYPFNVNFAPIDSDRVTNDRVRLWNNAKDTLCVQFKSEVSGPLGAQILKLSNHDGVEATSEAFSPYAICVNGARQVFILNISKNLQYKTDRVDLAALAIASAMGALSYETLDFRLKKWADLFYATHESLKTIGASELSAKDKLASQKIPEVGDYSDAYADIVW